jgi:hypothetical protein
LTPTLIGRYLLFVHRALRNQFKDEMISDSIKTFDGSVCRAEDEVRRMYSALNRRRILVAGIPKSTLHKGMSDA